MSASNDRCVLRLLLFGLVVFAWVGGVQAEPLFDFAEYPAGVEPRSVVLADFNGDAAPDMAVGVDGGDAVVVLLNRGNGLFDPPVFYRAGDDPRQVAVGDMDLDGNMDLIAAAYSSSTVTVLENNGDGTFVDLDDGAASVAARDGPVDLEVGLIDDDAYPDVLISAFPNELFVNDGSGGLESGVTPGGFGLGLDLADLDDDGDLDYVVGLEELTSYENDGAGNFSEAGSIEVEPRDSTHAELTLGDLDGDGAPDVATGNFTLSAVAVAFNDGDGTFSGAEQFEVGFKPSQVVMTDIDDDGDLDLAATSHGDGTLTVLLNDGSGAFTTLDPVPVDREAFGVAADDLDGDGLTDLAVVSNTCLGGSDNCRQGTVGTLFGRGDGTLENDEVLVMEGDREPRSVRGGDMDGDGDTDLVVAAGVWSQYMVYLNRGATLEKGSVVRVPRVNPGDASELAIADLDGDEDLDVVAGIPRAYRFGITHNNGGGALLDPEVGRAGASESNALTAADFNGNAAIDLALLSNDRTSGGSVLSIHLNDGNGVFPGMSDQPEPEKHVLDTYGRSLSSADVTGDSHVDLLSVHPPDQLLRFDNNGDGTFADPVAHTVGGDPSAVEPFDFDDDGVIEIVVTAPADREVVILENDGTGDFTEVDRLPVGADPFALASGDIDGDGDPDLVVANQGMESENATVLLNDGAGLFSNAGSFRARQGVMDGYKGWAGDAVTLADVDADGDLDIAMTNFDDRTVSIMHNRIVSPESTSATLSAGGSLSSDSEADGATWSDPVETTVTSPNAGSASISEGPHDGDARRGFRFLGHQVNIEAPAASVADPLIITFRLDASRIPEGVTGGNIRVFRDDHILAGCVDASSANPDPCVASRTFPGDGDVEITVRASAASAWNLGMRLPRNLEIELDLDTPFGDDSLTFVIPQWKIDLLFEAVSINNENKDEISANMNPFAPSMAPGSVLGDVTLRLRSGQKSPFNSSSGLITEQNFGQIPGLPEFPPYTDTGSANAHFDMFIELDIPNQGTLHNESPIELQGSLDTGWPPDSLEKFSFSSGVVLYDENGQASDFTIQNIDVIQRRIPPSVARIFSTRFESDQ